VNGTNTFVVLRLVTNVALMEGARVAQWVRSLDLTAQQVSGGGSRSTRREPPTLGKQLVNLIICDGESSAPSLLFTKITLKK
jgi:hypothetical protein